MPKEMTEKHQVIDLTDLENTIYMDCGCRTVVKIHQPTVDVDVLEAEDTLFRYGSAVFMPDGPLDENPPSDANGPKIDQQKLVQGLSVLKGFFRFCHISNSRGKPKKVLITGHTDSVGSDAYNKGLSIKRAQVIESLIVGAIGVPVYSTVATPGSGEDPFRSVRGYSVRKKEKGESTKPTLFMEPRRRFAKLCNETATIEDKQQILKWVSERLGRHPPKQQQNYPYWSESFVEGNKVDGIWGQKSRDGTKNFHMTFKCEYPFVGDHAGLAYSQDLQEILWNIDLQSSDFNFYTWLAIYEILQGELQRAMKDDGLDLAEIRSNIQWVDPTKHAVGCGETWPLEERKELKDAGFKSQSNRRVEILFYDPDELCVGKNKKLAEKANHAPDVGFLPCKVDENDPCEQKDCHIFQNLERDEDSAFKPILRWRYMLTHPEKGDIFDYGFKREQDSVLLSFSAKSDVKPPFKVRLYEYSSLLSRFVAWQTILENAADLKDGEGFYKSGFHHVLESGETLDDFVSKCGFENKDTIWKHFFNDDLRTIIEDSDLLIEGDNIYIPQRISQEAIPLGPLLDCHGVSEDVEDGRRFEAKWSITDTGYNPLDAGRWILETPFRDDGRELAKPAMDYYYPVIVVLDQSNKVVGISPPPNQLPHATEYDQGLQTQRLLVLFDSGMCRNVPPEGGTELFGYAENALAMIGFDSEANEDEETK